MPIVGSRLAVMLAAALATALVPAGVALVAEPASADAGPAVVVQLPQEARATPRGVEIIGRTDDGHIVLGEETEGTYEETYLLVAPDGSTTRLDSPIVRVSGDRLVQHAQTDATGTTVTSRPVDAPAWDTTTLPSGVALIASTRDGLLGLSGTNDLSVYPWSGAAPKQVTGVPADVSVQADQASLSGQYRVATTGSLALIRTFTADDRITRLLVDTSTGQSWTLDPAGTDCGGTDGTDYAIADSTIAWLHWTSTGERVLCTAPVPSPTTATVAAPQARPFTALSTGYYDIYDLVPTGTDVVVSLGGVSSAKWGTDPGTPVEAVDPQGAVRVLSAWGYGAVPAGGGHVVAVTGDQPGHNAVSDLDVATGASTIAVAVAPVAATFRGLAVDGDRVVSVDDSAFLGGVRQRRVDFGGQTASASSLLGSDAGGPVAGDAGATAWSSYYGDATTQVTAEGATRTGSVSPVIRTDDRWVVSSNGYLQDFQTGAQRFEGRGAVLQDGVVYLPGHDVPDGPRDSLILRDAATREASALAVPGCSYVTDVQVAGSWLLVGCVTPDNTSIYVLFRRDSLGETWQLSATDVDEPFLGNGFLVNRDQDGALTWTSLPEPGQGWSPTWQPLGTAQARQPGDFTGPATRAVAVSHGSVPTVAWFAGPQGYAALLPVATTPLPPHPTGILPPTSPQIEAVGFDRQIRVTWGTPPEGMTRYEADAVAVSPVAPRRSASMVVSGSSSGAWVPNAPYMSTALSNGYAYDVTVTATNIAGTAVSAKVRATPVAPPPAPADVQVTVDSLLSRATVSWTSASSPSAEPVDHFSIVADDREVATAPADATSASFVLPEAWQGPVRIYAEGVNQEGAPGESPTVSFPGIDSTPPVSRVSGVTKVSLVHRVTFTVAATDDRALAARPVDVRWRTATFGQRLGAWQSPPSWQGRQPGTLTVTGLANGQSACFSMRAHDAVGNVSAWTPAQCTAVAIDDTALSRVGPVRTLRAARYFHGSAIQLTSHQSELRLDGTRKVTGWLVATTCPTCGRVQVLFNGTTFGSVNLYSPVRHDRSVLPFPGPGDPDSGRLVLWPVNPAKRTIVDGVALLAH